MWICPKCGRAFKRQNQSHYCGEAPKTIDEYIAVQPDETQEFLTEIRNVIHKAVPEAQERISWSMPTYWKRHNIIQFAACRNHVGLYVGTEAVEAFEERLKNYKTSKGSIHLPYVAPIPSELIADIAARVFMKPEIIRNIHVCIG